MVRTSISEAKNRLSHFIRMVRSGEEIEIMDRDTPVARIVHVSKSSGADGEASWTGEAARLGLIRLPDEKGFPSDFLDATRLTPSRGEVLKALLEEREEGR